MGSELKPCPFCAGAPQLDAVRGVTETWWVECLDCSSGGPSLPSEREAVRAWNDVSTATARAEAAEQRAEAAEREVAQAQTERERARVDACLMLSLAWALDAPMLIGACFINGAYTAEIDALRGLCETTIAADRPGDLLAAIRRVLHHEATAVRGSPACVAAVARWEVSDE